LPFLRNSSRGFFPAPSRATEDQRLASGSEASPFFFPKPPSLFWASSTKPAAADAFVFLARATVAAEAKAATSATRASVGSKRRTIGGHRSKPLPEALLDRPAGKYGLNSTGFL
jgi:hypothetical protein